MQHFIFAVVSFSKDISVLMLYNVGLGYGLVRMGLEQEN